MTKKELIQLNKVLVELSNFGKTKFKYAILKNIDALKSNINVLLDVENEIKKHLATFEESRNNLILKIGKKGEDNSVFIDVKDKEMVLEFNEGLKLLIEEHKDELDLYNEKMADYQTLLEEDIEGTVVFKTISVDQLPDEDISITQLEILEMNGIISE